MHCHAICVLSVFFAVVFHHIAPAQVAKFRLEATDTSGVPVDSVTVGDEFLLKAYAQQVGGFADDPAKGGVFAGYLDISFDASLADVHSEAVEYSPTYSNGTTGDFSTTGLMDNIGAFASAEPPLVLPVPPGPDEQFLFSVGMKAIAAGELLFVGSESLSYPLHEVLVWTSLEPVPARDIDFGAEDLRVDFGTLSLNVQAVPEPRGIGGIILVSFFAVFLRRRHRPGTRDC